ncbi:MAG: hypothetical protein ACR2QM_17815, partial [Longimicrobiales bacterium]
GKVIGDRGAFQAEMNRALRFVLGLAVPVALLLLAARDVLVRLVFSEEFLEMIPLMVWTIPADVLAIVMGLLRIAVLASTDNRAFVVLGVGFEVVYALCFVVGLEMFGLQGAVASYAVSALIGIVIFGGYLVRLGLVRVPRGIWTRFGAGWVLLLSACLMPLSPFTRALFVLAAALWFMAERNELKRAFS